MVGRVLILLFVVSGATGLMYEIIWMRKFSIVFGTSTYAVTIVLTTFMFAERSQASAAEISKLSGSSVQVAEKAGQMLKQIVPDIQKTSELVQEIAAASNEQNAGADQVNRAILQLDQVIQQNATASEEMASTSEELSSQAEQLQNAIAYFTIDGTRSNTVSKRAAAPVKPVHITSREASPAPKPEVKSGNGNASDGADGYQIDMGSNSDDGDNQDAEFERY
jgi:methyl-accepting chemotaxis protein